MLTWRSSNAAKARTEVDPDRRARTVPNALTTATIDDLRHAAKKIKDGEVVVIETTERVTLARERDRREIMIEAGGYRFTLSTSSFFQVNRFLFFRSQRVQANCPGLHETGAKAFYFLKGLVVRNIDSGLLFVDKPDRAIDAAT